MDTLITCKDGFQISASVYRPKNLKAAVMIAPATGIRKRFYNSFATFLSENGFGVICFENRGIGDSVNTTENSVEPSLVSWGQLDMTSVFEELKTTFPGTDYHIIGHSAGGQLLGLMENSKEVKSLFNFASSSGSLRNMNYPFKLNASFYLNIFVPVSNLLFGKTNSQWVGMGEPLPKKVAIQWKKWCNGSGYVKTDFGHAVQDHLYNELSFPSMWVHATDDEISNDLNVKDMIRVYSKIDAQIVSLNPKEQGFKDIGHMKFFSSKYSKLWKLAINWLERN